MNARSYPRLSAAALVCLASLLSGPAPGGERWLEPRISLPGERFFRGAIDPVEGLVAALSVKNVSIVPDSMPRPRLSPIRTVDFEIYLLGTPTGVPASEEAPERTLIQRDPPLQPVGDRAETPDFTLKPGESGDFKLDVGRHYALKEAGRYEMTCIFQGERSNTLEFEVLPIKRVDVTAQVLLWRLDDYERGRPSFPFMFYITAGPGRFDDLVYFVRTDVGGHERYEYHRLSELAPGQLPQVVTASSRVGLVVPDKANDNLSRFFLVDFSKRPVDVKAEEMLHASGNPPALAVDASGGIRVE